MVVILLVNQWNGRKEIFTELILEVENDELVTEERGHDRTRNDEKYEEKSSNLTEKHALPIRYWVRFPTFIW